MKLTKKQRNRIYKRMLKYAINNPRFNYGLCGLIDYTFWNESKKDYKELWWKINIKEDSLAELCDKKPNSDKDYPYWFPLDSKGWKKRIKLLEECIEETS